MTDPLAAIRAEKAFAKLPPADRDRVLVGLFEAQRHIERERQYDRYGNRALRLRHRDALKSHLARTLEILADDIGWFDAVDWLTDRYGGEFTAAMAELRVFEATARRLLDGAMAFEPEVGRKGRGEMQLDAELPRRAFYELIEVLESVGVRVGATGGERGGPGTRLLALLIAYAVGSKIEVETVKVFVRERRRRK